METAITHHWLNGMRGGENVLEVFCQLYRNADIFTLFYEPEKISPIINKHRIQPSFLNTHGCLRKVYRNLFMLYPYVTEQFDLSHYDLILTSDTLSMKGVITNPDSCHICYCHTPPRYVWDMYFEYLNNSGLNKFKKKLARYFLHRYRQWDSLAANRVDYFLANSRFVAKRIAKYYRRKAAVINPPVRIRDFSVSEGGEYYLALGQLVPYKRIDLLVEAFNKMPAKQLVIAGNGPLRKTLEHKANKNIIFMGTVSDKKKRELYKGCKAFLFPGIEDYGITPIEAQACGKPVIAIGRGGVMDTVKGVFYGNDYAGIEEKTGLFFLEQKQEQIIDCVKYFETIENRFDIKFIRNHAEKFDEEIFKKKIKEYIDDKIKEFEMNGPPLK